MADIDGVMLIDGQVQPGVKELAQIFGDKLAMVSNNSTHTSVELCNIFTQAGVTVKPEQFFLAGEYIVKQLAISLNSGKILALGSPSILRLARQLGLQLLRWHLWFEAEAVLLCRDMNINYRKLESAANAALTGKPVFCANSDITHPSSKGIHLETGSLLALLWSVAPKMKVHILGKPAPELALQALKFVNTQSQDTLFLGDNLTTDAACARDAGIPFWHVGGNSGLSLMQAIKVWL